MIQLHCTQKLLIKLPLQHDGYLPGKLTEPYIAKNDKPSLLSSWHANLVLLQQRQCALFVHDTTRFLVLVPALKKKDFAELDYWFVDTFMNTLLKTGVNNVIMKNAQAALAPLVCDSDCNRSVQGTLNHMKQDIDYKLYSDVLNISDLSAYQASAWLADRPCSAKGVKGCIWPIRAMHELLANPDSRLH